MFSIIIPLYNKAPYILRALESVKNQSFSEYEVIVIDDGSSDEGPNLVLEQYGDLITMIHQTNRGVSESRNRGIAQSNFEYVAFLDADDYWHPDYLKSMAEAIHQFPKAGVWGTSYANHPDHLHDYQSSFSTVENYFSKAINNTLFFTSATVLHKSFFQFNTGFKTHLKRAEDLDVWFRAILFFGDPVYCPDKMVFYEIGDSGSATQTSFPIQHALVSEILDENYTAEIKGLSNKTSKIFDLFKEKYVLFNIFPYLSDTSNHPKIKSTLLQLKETYFFAQLPYRIPLTSLQNLLSFQFLKDSFRTYLKFCFRYLHKS